MGYIDILSRTIIIFITLFIWTRILGKKLISQMTVFDYVAGISLGALVGSSIMTPDLGVLKTMLSISLFAFLSFILGHAVMKHLIIRKVVNGEPTIVIRKGKILEDQLRKIKLNVNDLLMMLRKKDTFYIDEVDAAIVETDGTLSVLKHPSAMSATKKDLNINVKGRGLAYNLVIDGKIIKDSLDALHKSEDWLKTLLKANGYTSIENIILCQIDDQNHLYVDQKDVTYS
ncbi:uncharacterized membrane protein YcaP (DUF421 family) [Scopulibacillus daqui]|uniref:Uncharacterized membrane protein YcaP (DUF421 family) n=2 Tax=Scopulibacillus daqui TaxID=1469162 RepID=A0ABS2Q2N0_9BACL|nr:uncharacterized membrane protein YcaP (DUF421 family) [Scopulibacillus daqui]